MASSPPPSMRTDLPTSPLQRGLYGQDNTQRPGTLRAIFTNKHVLNSMKWGFCAATLISFHTLWHSRGNVMFSLTLGTMAFCAASPAKYWYYMRRQRLEFFRALQISAQSKDTNVVGTGNQMKKVRSREALYDPNEPYSDEEWAFAQRIYRKTILCGIGGACTGFLIGGAILTVMNATRVAPMWMRFGFCTATTLSGAALGIRFSLNSAIEEAGKWEKEGRLKQELKYVVNWMNAEKNEEKRKHEKRMQSSRQEI